MFFVEGKGQAEMVDRKWKGKAVAGKSSLSKRKPSFPLDSERSGSRKHRRPGVIQFFDHEADVVNDDKDGQGDDDHDSDFLSNDGMDLEDEKIEQRGNQVTFFLKEEEANDAEIEKLIRLRYKRGSKNVVHTEEVIGSDEESSSMQFTGDPIIWRVKCMRGHERELVVCLIQKFIDLLSHGNKLEMKSAFSLDHMKGHIYIEADRDWDIIEACKGLFGIYTNTIARIPSNEVPHLLSVRGASIEVSKDKWVRVKFGTYKGDLAKVVYVDDTHKRATIKLVPRVDPQSIINGTDDKKGIKKAAAPAPHLISTYELEKLRQFVKLKRDRRTGEVFETIGSLTLKNGYLYKKMPLESLNFWDVRPSDIELERFNGSREVPAKDHLWLSKLYGERQKNKSKEVIKVDKGKGSRLLGANEMREWELFDLVFLKKKGFGVIIGSDGNNFQVLKGNCERLEMTTATMQDIKQLQLEEETVSLDQNSNVISINDIVRILKGPFKDKQGIVKHIIQGVLFIYDNNHKETNGFCCARSKNCEAIKYSHGPSDESIYGCVPPGFEESTSQSTQSEPQKNLRQCRERPTAAGVRSGSSRDGEFYIGQTLRIRVGPLKGYLCRVIDAYRSDVTVKLDSQMKIIKVKGDDLTVVVARGYGNVARDHWTGIPSTSTDLPGVENANTSGLSWQLPDERTISGAGQQQGTSCWDITKIEDADQADLWNKAETSDLSGDQMVHVNEETENMNESNNWNAVVVKGQHSGSWDKLAMDTGDQTNCWIKEPATTTGWSENWDGELNVNSRAGDSWGKAMTMVERNCSEQSSGGWNHKTGPSQNQSDGWGKPANQGNRTDTAVAGETDSWGKASGGWSSRRDARSQYDGKAQSWKEPASQWYKSEVAASCQTGSSQSDVKTQSCKKAKVGDDDQAECWEKTTGGWENKKGNTSGNNCDGWGKQSGQKNKVEIDVEIQTDSHGGDQATEKGAAGWDRSSNEWNKPDYAARGQADCWGVQNKETDASAAQVDGWDKSMNQCDKAELAQENQGDVWANTSGGQHKDKGGTFQLDGWDKPKGQWNKAEDAACDQVGCWEKISGGWRKQTDTSGSQADGWHGASSQSRQDGSSWNKSAGWSESKSASGNEHRGWSRSNHGNEGGLDHQQMERGPGRGRGRGRWNGRGGDRPDNWRKPRADSSDIVNHSGGHQRGGWQKNEENDRENEPAYPKKMENTWDEGKGASANQAGQDWKETWGSCGFQSQGWSNRENASGKQTAATINQTPTENCDTNNSGYTVGNHQQSHGWNNVAGVCRKESGGWGASSGSKGWDREGTGGRNKSNGWGEASVSRNTTHASGNGSAGWRTSLGSQDWVKTESTGRNTSGSWGTLSGSQNNTESGGRNASDGWGKAAENRNSAADASRKEADGWGMPSRCGSWDKTGSAGGNASDGWGKAAEGSTDAVDASGKEAGGWGKSSGSQKWETTENACGNTSDGWGEAVQAGKNDADAGLTEAGGCGMSSGSQSRDKTKSAGGNTSGGWGKATENIDVEANKEAGGWGMSSGSHSRNNPESAARNASDGWVKAAESGGWGLSSGSGSRDKTDSAGGNASDGWGNAAEGSNSASDACRKEAGGWGKPFGSQSSDATQGAGGNASDGWGRALEAGKNAADASSKGAGGWGTSFGSQSWDKIEADGGGEAAGGWNSAVDASANEAGGWGKAHILSGSQSWEKEEGAGRNNSGGWGRAADGWSSTPKPTGSHPSDDWKTSAPTSWEKVNSWQQSAESGQDSKSMQEDGSKRWNRPRFGDSGYKGFCGRGRGPPGGSSRAGLLGRGPPVGDGRGGRGRGPSDGFGRGGRGRGPSDGNGRGFRGRGPQGGSGRGWNRDNERGDRPGNWRKPTESENHGGNHQWDRDESSHQSGSWSSWATADGRSGQANDGGWRKPTEPENQGANQQWNKADQVGDQSGSSSWAQ